MSMTDTEISERIASISEGMQAASDAMEKAERRIGDLTAQRDELLAALKTVTGALISTGANGMSQTIAEARAAIARAGAATS